jgi:hypothetical protein
MQKINRLGETKFNKHGSKMTIIEYPNGDNILVKFDNGYITKAQYIQFKNGTLLSPYDKTICNIGYLGDFKNINAKTYNMWKKMLERCYDVDVQAKHPTYTRCVVCNEWHNYQNYSKWYNDNYYEIEGEVMEVDKDILIKNNKIYSPNNCVIVPSSINCLFTKNNALRGKYPIGVYFKLESNKFVAQCSIPYSKNRKVITLGYYSTEIEAFNAYKQFKEEIIKNIADKYKNKIPYKLYKAMYDYMVEITD